VISQFVVICMPQTFTAAFAANLRINAHPQHPATAIFRQLWQAVGGLLAAVVSGEGFDQDQPKTPKPAPAAATSNCLFAKPCIQQ